MKKLAAALAIVTTIIVACRSVPTAGATGYSPICQSQVTPIGSATCYDQNLPGAYIYENAATNALTAVPGDGGNVQVATGLLEFPATDGGTSSLNVALGTLVGQAVYVPESGLDGGLVTTPQYCESGFIQISGATNAANAFVRPFSSLPLCQCTLGAGTATHYIQKCVGNGPPATTVTATLSGSDTAGVNYTCCGN